MHLELGQKEFSKANSLHHQRLGEKCNRLPFQPRAWAKGGGWLHRLKVWVQEAKKKHVRRRLTAFLPLTAGWNRATTIRTCRHGFIYRKKGLQLRIEWKITQVLEKASESNIYFQLFPRPMLRKRLFRFSLILQTSNMFALTVQKAFSFFSPFLLFVLFFTSKTTTTSYFSFFISASSSSSASASLLA